MASVTLKAAAVAAAPPSSEGGCGEHVSGLAGGRCVTCILNFERGTLPPSSLLSACLPACLPAFLPSVVMARGRSVGVRRPLADTKGDTF